MVCRALREGGYGLRWGLGKRRGRASGEGRSGKRGGGQSGSRASFSRILHPKAAARARWDMGLRRTGQRGRERGERRSALAHAPPAQWRSKPPTEKDPEPRVAHGPQRTLGKHKPILLVPAASLDGRLATLGSNRACRNAWSAVPCTRGEAQSCQIKARGRQAQLTRDFAIFATSTLKSTPRAQRSALERHDTDG